MHRASLLAAAVAMLIALGCGGTDDAASCNRSGGHWECKDPVAQTACRCAAKATDAARSCTDSHQCTVRCLHTEGTCSIDATGRCQSFHDVYGCYEELILDKPDPMGPVVATCHSTC